MFSFLRKKNNVIKFSLYFIFFLISLINFLKIDVSILLYFIFIFFSFLFLRNIFILENSFGNIVLSTFIFLGFWFKFSFNTLANTPFGEGVGFFDFSKNGYNEVLKVCIVFHIAFILGHSTYSKLNISKYTINLVEIKKLFQKKILLYIWIISIFVISICIFNYYNKIFLRGKPFNENFILYENFFKIFYKVFAAALIYFSFDLTLNSDLSKRKKIILFFLLAFILNFIYLSQLSREGGVHILVLMLSLFLIQKNKEYKENDKLYYVLIFFFFFWFILSLLFIQYQRFEVNFTISVSSPNYIMIDNSIALLFNRWVGIDAVMAIVSNNDKGWDLLNNIINNRVNWTHNVAWPNKSNLIDPFHVNLPGPAAFFYISGSFILLFFLSFITFFIFFLLESIINLIKKDFILMGNFLVFILAYRIIHTGLGLNNLFYFILLIIFCVFFLLISNYFYKFTK